MAVNPDTATLRERRLALGLTQMELAYRTRCSLSMLQLYERGMVAVQRSEVAARLDAALTALEDAEPARPSP